MRIGFTFPNQKQKQGVADGNLIAVAKQPLLYGNAVHEGAVETLQIDDLGFSTVSLDHTVVPGYGFGLEA